MAEELNLWRLAAGLGLFLFGMHTLEMALRQLAGRPFKRFLRQYTAKPARGVLAGALSTAALQSSSVVSLIVLAFVGAGIISLSSAIGIVFGSNVGTTITGWIVATVGFKLDIDALALPLIAVGGLGIVWSAEGTRRSGVSYLLAGFGLMMMGLEFMKSGAVVATRLFDPGALAAYPLIVFLLAGFLLTAVIQSSSATIMITISALYAGVIPLPSAAAVAIGADLGTTVTALLGALAGSEDKKRVAAAIIVFNVVVDVIAFVFLQPLLALVTDVFGISDPLYALVAFHSTFNFLGVLIFLPWVRQLSRWLSRRFQPKDRPLLRHIETESDAVPEAAVENATREMYRLIDQVAALNQRSFGLASDKSFYDSDEDRAGVSIFRGAKFDDCYADIKHLEGAIVRYLFDLQHEQLEAHEAARVGQIIPGIRNAVHSAKCIKDVREDLSAFRESVNDRFNAYGPMFRETAGEFYEELATLRGATIDALRFECLVKLKNANRHLHAGMRAHIYDEVSGSDLSQVEISTLLNVNRELYASNESLIGALSDAMLSMESAEDFAAMPSAT